MALIFVVVVLHKSNHENEGIYNIYIYICDGYIIQSD